MKIGIVLYPTYGGSGVVATELGIGLAEKGHQVHFITYRTPVRLASTFHQNIYYHEVGVADYPLFEYTPYDTALTSKLVDVVLNMELDLLHVHYAIPHATVAYMAKMILATKGVHLPVVTTLHGTDITLVGRNKEFAPVVEFGINSSNGVTAVSKNLRDETYAHFNISKEIEVIYNFIDFERFRPTDKKHFKQVLAPNGEPILAHVSNFRKVKRVDDVIRVFERVYRQIPCKLLLIGDGPERSKLEKLCRDIGLCHEVRFLGKQDAVEELLNIADLFILPSENESFGLAALEAMACKVPVISSNVGGLPEINIDGETGYLSDVGDVNAMSVNALKILSNPELQHHMKNAAFEQAKRFEIQSIIPQYVKMYEEVIANTKKPIS